MKLSKHFAVKSITKNNLPFFIGWVSIFVWLYSYFLPFGSFRFESAQYNDKVIDNNFFTTIWLVSGLAAGLFIDGKRLIKYTFIPVALDIICFVTMIFTPAGLISDVFLSVASVCMGYIFASCCYAFFMILNNTEKFYSMVLAVAIPKLLLLLKPVLNNPSKTFDGSYVIITLIFAILLVCSILFCKIVYKAPQNNSTTFKPPPKSYSLMFLVFAVLVLNDVIAPAVINATKNVIDVPFEQIYFIGALIGVIIIIIFQKFLQAEIYNIINMSFACATLGFVSSVLTIADNKYAVIAYLFFGISYVIGFVNIYYLAGFMAKKFQSVTFYKIGISLSAIFYFIAIICSRFLMNLDSKYSYDTMALSAYISIFILIAFLSSAPIFINNLKSGEWMDDTYRVDITYETRLEAKLRDYSLSPREIETCLKLLEGFTLRQISAIMGISFSTVNTYCTSIYKKMNINSRTELVVLLKEYSLK